jgi:multicomponent Na+:H+ antiporter subunit C
MTHYLVYGLGGALICSIGVYGMLARPHLLHTVVAANLMGSGIFLILIGLGNRTEGRPDPVPQAMVLTGIVVTVALTALGLAIVKRYYTVTGLTGLDDDPPEAGAS